MMGKPKIEDDIYTAEQHTNVHAAIAYVMERVAYVQKQSAPGLRYTFAGEEGLIDAVRAEVVAAGLVLTVDDVECIERGEYSTGRGSRMQSTVLRLRARWTHWPTGTQATVCAVGEGADVGDKSAPKAMTGAYKYLIRETFLLKTGDDPDLDASVPRQEQRKAAPAPSPRPARQTAPQGEQGAQGAGGSTQECAECGNPGITARFWSGIGDKSPDLECASGCSEEYNGKTRPRKWWSMSRQERQNRAAAAAPAPPTAAEEDIPF